MSIHTEGSFCGVVANMLKCDIIVSLNSSHAIAVTFGLIPMVEV